MKTDMKCVLFTDESRASLDGPDGCWSKGWVFRGDQCPARIRRQQGGGGVMIWAGIAGDSCTRRCYTNISYLLPVFNERP